LQILNIYNCYQKNTQVHLHKRGYVTDLADQFSQLSLFEVIFHLLFCLRHYVLNQALLMMKPIMKQRGSPFNGMNHIQKRKIGFVSLTPGVDSMIPAFTSFVKIFER